MTDRIRLLIVDDHTMVRRGLTMFLQAYDDLELIGEAASGPEAIRLCASLKPDVVLMDLLMPGMDGPTAIRAIRQAQPEIQVIALTSFGKEELVKAALVAGAVGFLLKNVSADELAEAVRAAKVGQPTLAREATQALISAVTRPMAPGHDLTSTERKVLALMVEGLNNVEIAERLGVTRSTIKTHVSNILAKLGVASRVEAVKVAVEHNLVSSPD